MKKLFLFCIVILFTTIFSENLFGQYKFFTGGQFNYASSGNSENDNKQTVFGFLPYLGYSVNDNIIVGLGLGFNSQKTVLSGSSDYTISANSLQIQPFGRYRKSVSDKLGLYGELGFIILNGKAKTSFPDFPENDSEQKFNNFNVYAGPGIDYAFSDRWVVNALWGAISYSVASLEDDPQKDNVFAFSLNPAAINLSLNYLF